MKNTLKELARRVVALVLVALLIVSSLAGQVRLNLEVSSFVNAATSVAAKGFFRGAFRFAGGPRGNFRYAGGVVPGKGKVDFWKGNPKEHAKIDSKELKFVVLDKEKLRNNSSDYDAIAIQWKGVNYLISTRDDMLIPSMKFLERNSDIAYTIPYGGFNAKYFKDNALEEARINPNDFAPPTEIKKGYVAKEFHAPVDHLSLLEDADFAKSEMFPWDDKADALRDALIKNITIPEVFDPKADGGTYLNADYNVIYQAYFDDSSGKKVINVGGVPLRFFWEQSAYTGHKVEWDVEKLAFPAVEFDKQDQTIMFFQTMAILKQIKDGNPTEFARFLKEVEADINAPVAPVIKAAQ